MKTHPQTKEVAVQASHSIPQAFSPLGDVPPVCINSLTYSSVTFSTFSIPAPENVQRVTYPEGMGTHKPIYWENAVLNYASLDLRLKDVDVRILTLMVRAIRQKDRRMIVGNRKLAGLVYKKERTVSNSLNRIRKAGYLKCIRIGNGRNNASEDIVGEMFSAKKAFWCREQVTQRLKSQRVQINDTKGCKKLLPHPINHPIKEIHPEKPMAFNGGGWLEEIMRKPVAMVSSHLNPTFEEFRREAERIGIPRSKVLMEHSRLTRSGWVTADGNPIGNWKAYLNAFARRERRSL